jgi:hypothetical protein
MSRSSETATLGRQTQLRQRVRDALYLSEMGKRMTFWNKVQSGVSRAAAEAEKQAKVTRLNFQVGEVQTTLRRKQQELGEVALQLARDGKLSDPAVDALVASIDEQEARMAELRAQVTEIQGAVPPATT